MYLLTSIVKYLPFFSSILYLHENLHLSRSSVADVHLPALNCVTRRMSQQYFDQYASCKFPVIFMGKDDKFERKVRCKGLYFFFIACGSCQLYPPLRSSSKFFQGPFWSSALFGQFLKLDHRHQSLRPYSYLQRKTSSINQLLSRQIFGWSIKRSAALSTSLSYTTFLAGVVS